MKSFSEILQSSRLVEGRGQTFVLDTSWMQGRAIYGGLSTALCLHGIFEQLGELPPLRSTSINFLGPASIEVYVKAKILRRGKSVAFVETELLGEKGLICKAIFCFGAARESKLAEVYLDFYEVPKPALAESFFPEEGFLPIENGGRPAFTQHFDARLIKGSRPFSGAPKPSFELWVKHKDLLATDITALVALADMPPPGVLPVFESAAPISTMSWMFNILTNDLSNASGWWLLGVYSEHASEGYSSQNMTIRNDRGELVLVGRQNVAIFY